MRPPIVASQRSSSALTRPGRRPLVLLAISAVAATAFLFFASRAPAISSPSISTMASKTSTTSAPSPPRFASIDFEVYGKVQGVWFRQHVTDKADEINKTGKKLVGWVRNTKDGSVEGVAQGEPGAVAELEHFVTRVGSPLSRIDRFEVTNRREVDALEFERFERRY